MKKYIIVLGVLFASFLGAQPADETTIYLVTHEVISEISGIDEQTTVDNILDRISPLAENKTFFCKGLQDKGREVSSLQRLSDLRLKIRYYSAWTLWQVRQAQYVEHDKRIKDIIERYQSNVFEVWMPKTHQVDQQGTVPMVPASFEVLRFNKGRIPNGASFKQITEEHYPTNSLLS